MNFNFINFLMFYTHHPLFFVLQLPIYLRTFLPMFRKWHRICLMFFHKAFPGNQTMSLRQLFSQDRHPLSEQNFHFNFSSYETCFSKKHSFKCTFSLFLLHLIACQHLCPNPELHLRLHLLFAYHILSFA